jgi:hypothetical protein
VCKVTFATKFRLCAPSTAPTSRSVLLRPPRPRFITTPVKTDHPERENVSFRPHFGRGLNDTFQTACTVLCLRACTPYVTTHLCQERDVQYDAVQSHADACYPTSMQLQPPPMHPSRSPSKKPLPIGHALPPPTHTRSSRQHTCAKKGMYRMTQCRPRLMHVATSSHGLLQGGSCSRLLSSLKALKALNISMATSTDSDSVLAFRRPAERQSPQRQ